MSAWLRVCTKWRVIKAEECLELVVYNNFFISLIFAIESINYLFILAVLSVSETLFRAKISSFYSAVDRGSHRSTP